MSNRSFGAVFACLGKVLSVKTHSNSAFYETGGDLG